MTEKEINKHIQQLIDTLPMDEVICFVKGECQTVSLTPQTLGKLFEMYAEVTYDSNDPTSGHSREILISELKNIHPGFQSTNGNQWARTDGSYLGQRYFIKRKLDAGKVVSVQLNGINDSIVRSNRGIRKDIANQLSKERCVVLDVGTNIEIDHKNARYDNPRVLNTETQTIDDFQAMSKATNDAKRQHCKNCIRTGKRFDATCLGYKEGFIVGDENTSICIGCYWYDPKRFNQIISKDFQKEDSPPWEP